MFNSLTWLSGAGGETSCDLSEFSEQTSSATSIPCKDGTGCRQSWFFNSLKSTSKWCAALCYGWCKNDILYVTSEVFHSNSEQSRAEHVNASMRGFIFTSQFNILIWFWSYKYRFISTGLQTESWKCSWEQLHDSECKILASVMREEKKPR